MADNTGAALAGLGSLFSGVGNIQNQVLQNQQFSEIQRKRNIELEDRIQFSQDVDADITRRGTDKMFDQISKKHEKTYPNWRRDPEQFSHLRKTVANETQFRSYLQNPSNRQMLGEEDAAMIDGLFDTDPKAAEQLLVSKLEGLGKARAAAAEAATEQVEADATSSAFAQGVIQNAIGELGLDIKEGDSPQDIFNKITEGREFNPKQTRQLLEGIQNLDLAQFVSRKRRDLGVVAGATELAKVEEEGGTITTFTGKDLYEPSDDGKEFVFKDNPIQGNASTKIRRDKETGNAIMTVNHLGGVPDPDNPGSFIAGDNSVDYEIDSSGNETVFRNAQTGEEVPASRFLELDKLSLNTPGNQYREDPGSLASDFERLSDALEKVALDIIRLEGKKGSTRSERRGFSNRAARSPIVQSLRRRAKAAEGEAVNVSQATRDPNILQGLSFALGIDSKKGSRNAQVEFLAPSLHKLRLWTGELHNAQTGTFGLEPQKIEEIIDAPTR